MRLRVCLIVVVLLLVPSSIRGGQVDIELNMDSFTVFEKGPVIKMSLSGIAKQTGKFETFVYEIDFSSNTITQGGVSHPMNPELVGKVANAIYPLQRGMAESIEAWHKSNERMIDSIVPRRPR